MHAGISTNEVLRAVITGAAGDVTAVAAVAGKKIRCIHYFIHQAAAGAVRFESGAGGTALTGVMVTTAENLQLKDSNDYGLFQTATGEALSIEAGTGAVQGYLLYQLV
jgi:hypothetical protein